MQMDKILALIAGATRVAISSDPGSGKSTRIPPALVGAGYRVLVLEPRRISALSLATHISENLNSPIGNPIGYQVRGDSKRSAQTKALFATEALLPKYLDTDPALSQWDVVILDEFHERHLHTDVAWALLNQIQRELRPELKIILLSATLNLTEITRSWPGAEVLHLANPPHPLTISYVEVTKALTDPRAVRRALVQVIKEQPSGGDILVFLPGVADIRRAHEDLQVALRPKSGMEIVELYGAQSLGEQRAALKKSSNQKIILATNVAESSITIDGVRTVVDCGLERTTWANGRSGLSELKTQRISKASATQRAGRAARQSAGTCIRLWSELEQSALDDFHVAEIHRSDLSEVLYSIYSSGWDPLADDFTWFERPHASRLNDALAKLIALKLLSDQKKALPRREALSEYPTGLRGAIYLASLRESNHHPRLADCAIAAMIATPDGRSPHDLGYLRDIEALAKYLAIPMSTMPHDFEVGKLSEEQKTSLADAVPDRFFERRSPGAASVKLTSGRGATLSPAHQHESAKFGAAILLREADPDALIGFFAPIDKKLYRVVEAALVSKAAPAKESKSQDVFASTLLEITSLLQRAAIFKATCVDNFDLKPTLDLAAAALLEAHPQRDLAELESEIIQWTRGMISPQLWQRFESACPSTLKLPRSGKVVPLKYLGDTRVEVHARLQEFLGVTIHPKIGEDKIPLTLVLLSPALRPIQITQRLEDFWTGSYVEIRKEMKARYPKHEW